jgi:hypothetical protein
MVGKENGIGIMKMNTSGRSSEESGVVKRRNFTKGKKDSGIVFLTVLVADGAIAEIHAHDGEELIDPNTMAIELVKHDQSQCDTAAFLAVNGKKVREFTGDWESYGYRYDGIFLKEDLWP